MKILSRQHFIIIFLVINFHILKPEFRIVVQSLHSSPSIADNWYIIHDDDDDDDDVKVRSGLMSMSSLHSSNSGDALCV